jgi:prepilin-type N-terminal cleavage/methylation domain-containing protein
VNQTKLRRAFTLVELLVVIAIIVVLLAILVPSLSKAMYRAELAKCGATLDTITTSILQYSHDHRDRYPYRRALDLNIGKDEGLPAYLYSAGLMGLLQYTAGKRNDDRPTYARYMNVNSLIDPFCPEFDLTRPDTMQENDDVFASYDMWWDWGYVGEGKMQKRGNSVTWRHPATGKMYRWNILIMDRDSSGDTYPGSASAASHPDADGALQEDLRDPDTTSSMGFELWVSQWSTPSATRSNLDRNFGYDDGSVQLVSEILGGASGNQARDPRMSLAPLDQDGASYETKFVLVPSNN